MTVIVCIKLLGVGCILACGYLVGNERILKFKRSKLLHLDILRLLERLEENFRYQKDPLPQLITRINAQQIFDVLSLPRCESGQKFSDYRKTLSKLGAEKLALSQLESDEWERMWMQMGSLDGEEEAARLKGYQVIMQKELRHAEEKEREAIRLYRSIGLTVAAVVAVLLL